MKKNNNFIIFLLSFNIFLVLATSFFGYKYFTNDSSVNQPIACREDAKICPDGSSVGRIGPKCEFSQCPDVVPSVTPLKIYKNSKYGFQFEYSSDIFKYVSPLSDAYLSTTESNSPMTLGQNDMWISVSVTSKSNQKEISKIYNEINGPQVVYGFRSQKIIGDKVYKIDMSSSSSETILSNEKYFDQIISSFKISPESSSQTSTYLSDYLGFSFEYPTKYVLTSNLENGETGQKFTLWLTNQNSEKIIIGGVTRDYSAGRSGEFTDSQGYLKNSEGVFIRFVNKLVPINPLVFNNIITNPHNINVLYVIGQSDSFETSSPGDPGIGYEGAIINLRGKSFPGISLFYKTSPDNKIKSDFNYIVSSFKIL